MAGNSEPPRPNDFFGLLADDTRWKLLVALVRSDRRVQELAHLVGQPEGVVTEHLARLRDFRIATARRSDADHHDTYYSLDLDRLRELYLAAGAALHPALADPRATSPRRDFQLPPLPLRVLFLCTGNSARSQVAEALLRDLTKGQIEVYSAGTSPAPVHPLAIMAMAEMGLDISRQRPKHLDVFRGQSFDYVITVCDRVREVCPAFPGDPSRIHWSFPDPVTVEGAEAERYRVFQQMAMEMLNRLRLLLIVIEREKAEAEAAS